MACGWEALIIGMRLATELVRSEPNPGLVFSRQSSIPAVCGCSCAGTPAQQLRCRANDLEAEAEQVARREAKVTEFNQIANMCQVTRGTIP